jgi:ABC-type ATPase involved in cell division
MQDPKLLLMDEPSMGLAPVLVDFIFEIIQKLNQQGKTILLVEQKRPSGLANRPPRLCVTDRPPNHERPGQRAGKSA